MLRLIKAKNSNEDSLIAYYEYFYFETNFLLFVFVVFFVLSR